MSKVENGVVVVQVGGRRMEIQVRNGKFVKPKELKAFAGIGTALKPAHEPIIEVSKNAEALDGPPFKYQAKAARKERNAGCEELFWFTDQDGTFPLTRAERALLEAEAESRKGEDGFKPVKLSEGNIWPTVKPLELCRYLVKMVKMPEGNMILDPFMGSGTVPVACHLEGCRCIGIDNDPVAFRIAEARMAHAESLS